ncbi:ubiquinone biosynthesis protein COQ4 [Parvibaculum indicum]|uniref:Coq4 family protein n=1 Tax=Parvibaculum indicum TaxID=562969 RepID=UPI001422AEFA|nr:Coq4 family protein [Parvibaculum indicum]NIJ42401.1 ubiquinone biosynthesis protein COQ4 [Parvibaculum indicum]
MTVTHPAGETNDPAVKAAERPRRKRIQPLKALAAIRALKENKEDTGQVFKVIEALSGGAEERLFHRFEASHGGKRVLGEKLDLLSVLCDREKLAAMPEGSLGAAYYRFMTSENLTADGLVEASNEMKLRENMPEAGKRFRDRIRDQHDLWHIVTGYGRDGLGELSLLAFSYAQTRNRGIGAIVLLITYSANKTYAGCGLWRAIREGYRRGREAHWLPAEIWEELLPLPLEQVRAKLAVTVPAPEYRRAMAAAEALDLARAELGQPTGDVKLAA